MLWTEILILRKLFRSSCRGNSRIRDFVDRLDELETSLSLPLLDRFSAIFARSSDINHARLELVLRRISNFGSRQRNIVSHRKTCRPTTNTLYLGSYYPSTETLTLLPWISKRWNKITKLRERERERDSWSIKYGEASSFEWIIKPWPHTRIVNEDSRRLTASFFSNVSNLWFLLPRGYGLETVWNR